MDFVLAACQGTGLAIATGAFAGAAGRRGTIGGVLLAFALAAGAILFGISLAAEDHPAWPGWPVGALVAGLSYVAIRDLAAGAARRAEGGGFVSAMIALAALALAGISVLVRPVGLLALLGVIWLLAGRRRQAARKYEGLRTLR